MELFLRNRGTGMIQQAVGLLAEKLLDTINHGSPVMENVYGWSRLCRFVCPQIYPPGTAGQNRDRDSRQVSVITLIPQQPPGPKRINPGLVQVGVDVGSGNRIHLCLARSD